MIEIHHGGKLFLIMDEALLLGMGPKLLYTQVKNWLGKQSVDDFLKVQPPSLQNQRENRWSSFKHPCQSLHSIPVLTN